MDVSKPASHLLADEAFLDSLSPGVIEILRAGSNNQYLDTLARLALQPSDTSTIFSIHHDLSVELCSRWLHYSTSQSNGVEVFGSLARILPIAPYLSSYIMRLLQLQENGPLASLSSTNIDATSQIPETPLCDILLALCRLLQFDNEVFAHLVVPAQIQLLLIHTHPPIRCLAIRILCLYLHGSESTLQEMMGKYIGLEEMKGRWDDRIIDYRFFSLWEEQRLRNLRKDLEQVLQEHAPAESPPAVRRIITDQDLSPTTVRLAETLLPSAAPKQSAGSSLVMTRTVAKNMQSFAKAIKSDRPILLTGPLGAGKTSLVRDAARQLGLKDTMLVLHLNEQIDTKMLIGMYTTKGGPGSFTWQPGVLTKAVTEGRWVLIEDFDRAPAEVVSVLLPLLERKEMLIPHWGERLRAAPGFKIIATIRSSEGTEGGKILPRRTLLGARHWEQVDVDVPPNEELREIVIQRFPILHAYLSRILSLYARMRDVSVDRSIPNKLPGHAGRSPGPQDLFRWCSRINHLLQSIGVSSGNEPISEVAIDNILLEAVDCFASCLPNGILKEEMIAVIAQELQVSSERVSYCLETRNPRFLMDEKTLRIGRTNITRRRPGVARNMIEKQKRSPFATTHRVLRHLESIAAAIQMAEPCLLVGETGTGKTTMIQQFAESLNHKLVVVNLSQQSEAGDLLGGFKPVNMRALAIPMNEEFNDLIEGTLSVKKNQRYIEHITKVISKAISKNNWSRVLALWRDAAITVQSTLQPLHVGPCAINEEPLLKRRKVETPKYQTLRKRWETFAGQLSIFQKHLESGSKGFAFSFVEGNIVKAARNGDWVLLDEINLAAADTLDSFAGLLAHDIDDGPSLLLTETGDTERIRAHRDFRIFGAMNPASDVGKRDLPLGLRTRFTELFIDPPDKDLENLVPLVQAYLGSNGQSDTRVSNDVAYLYLEIQSLARENRLVDGADQKPYFSLRTLTRTLIYVRDIAPTYGLRRALFEGFSMSFLTLLNKISVSYILPLMNKHLLGNQKNSQALLMQAPKAPYDTERFVKFRQYWMMKGSLPSESQPRYIITPFIEKNLLNLVRATSTRKFPILLQGPTSSGKTSMVEYLANISGNKFVRINNHEHTDLQEYLGTYVSGSDGQLHYQKGILTQALQEGFWIVLDELNLAPTDVLEALNRLLDDNRELFIPETQQFVRPHENFMLFATQNPPGIYGGRKVLSRAFRNRFLELHFDDIPEDELEVILRERSQIAPSFCTRIVAVYKKLSLYRQRSRLFEQKDSFATLRDLFRWAFRDADDCQQLAINGYYLLAERVRDDEERQVVKRTIEEVMKTKIDDGAVYAMDRIPSDLDAAAHGIIWTRSMRRLYILVTEALKNREPVLLVGETGSGKTTVCQIIAAAMQTQLHIVNAHQNMETGDLIGSQRPIRSRRSIEIGLRKQLHEVLSDHVSLTDLGDGSLQTLLQLYRTLPKRLLEDLALQLRKSLDQSLSQFNALFEWVDGSLVNAMKAGHHFLLDEISLADDSVLERLNSVLEPSRELFLAEKGINDALITAATGFQFLATMNPGGDYGKKELSPALRNRFTEIWVPHASNQDEMQEILEHKLGQHYAHFAKPMVAFAHWYGDRFASSKSEMSIRDLLAWVAFFNTRCVLDEHLSLLHGAALVYVDALGANPAAKLHNPGTTINEQRQLCLHKLSNLFQSDMAGLYYSPTTLGYNSGSFTVGPFTIQKYSGASLDPQYNLQAPTTMGNVMKIARALQLPRPILLEGSPGVGKTTLVAALAQACGIPLTRINLSDQTDLMDLFGSDVPTEGGVAGQFEWHEAPFLRAMQQGEWVLLDEMNLASQSVLEGLNACFDHRGQVYVSELDQTFTRHPNFVVFAAQNPHHQGSGRKGLPISFVNRFSVLYADTFNAEDLQMICSEKFPSVHSEDISNLTECVARVEVTLQQHRQLGIRGGPWEINLRDTTRWLELVSSPVGLLSAGVADHYVAMLFSQRFRTCEDAAAILSTFEERLPDIGKFRDRTLAIHANHLEVGLGFLSRQLTSSGSINQQHHLPHSHLPLLESIMVCIQNNWPVLLVGPSGSGKTSLIRHVASCAGADLVELSINADMDTTDLVGGFEQSDYQRHSASYIHRLKDFTKKARLQRLVSSSLGPRDFMNELESVLASGTAEITKVIDILQRLVGETSGGGFNQYLHEGTVIVEKSMHGNRARFEWVDGILVKSIVEGKWLILDNANLCSPSVLDRLNSLLEPNGVLIINERHSSDGSARIVKPHPNFRMFLTMDPHYGELSRAMRNRNIELFLPSTEVSEPHDGINLTFDSATVRFQSFQRISPYLVEEPDFHELIWIFLDHLAISDHDLIKSWSQQVSAGLVGISSKVRCAFLSIVQSFGKVLVSGRRIIQGIKDEYHRLLQELGLPFDFETTQTIQPMNNFVLVVFQNKANMDNELLRLGSILDTLIDITRFEDTFASVVDSTRTQPPSQLSRLQKSIMSGTSRRSNEELTNQLAPFLVESLQILRMALERANDRQHNSQSVLIGGMSPLRAFLCFLSDIFDIAHSNNFDEASFLLYLYAGKEAVSSLKLQPATVLLAETLERGLDNFNPSWQLRSGQSMELLWSRLKPRTPTTSRQLDLNIKIEQLADRFDKLLWTTNMPLSKLNKLRDSIARIGRMTMSLDDTRIGLKDITKALADLEAEQSILTQCISPYLQPEFEALRQYRVASADANAAESEVAVGLVAAQPTKELWQQCFDVADLTGISNKDSTLATIRESFPISVLQKLEEITEVPLKSLDLLRQEISLVGLNIATLTSNIVDDHQSVLLNVVGKMHCQIAIAHEQYLHPYNRQKPCSNQDIWHLNEELPSSQYLRNVAERFLQPSWALITGRDDQHTLKDTASSWILFFTGCLSLYVPDHPYDPALKALVARDRHQKRTTALCRKLSALKQFERLTTGQPTNLRCQYLEEELKSMGEEPSVETILRPRTSQLDHLQVEFSNILQSIVSRSPDQQTLTWLLGGDQSVKSDFELLRANITQAIIRLGKNFRSYDDITKPLIGMLHGLDAGLAMAQIAAAPGSSQAKAIENISQSTPFLGMRPQLLNQQEQNDSTESSHILYDSRLKFLECFAVMNSMIKDSQIRAHFAVFKAFHDIYNEWKDQLSEDQRKGLAKSSMYRYRGAEADADGDDDDDFRELFPNFEAEDHQHTAGFKFKHSPRTIAQLLARYQRNLFDFELGPVERILDLIQSSCTDIARIWECDSGISKSPLPTRDVLCGLILKLDETADSLKQASPKSLMFNFYNDPNLAEAQKLISLVRQVQARFVELKQAWPEHSTLDDVLRTTTNLLALRHTEPIAKLITKVEQLHGYVYQWQMVASREYTAAAIYDQLTSLIVDWRRLELSTWSRLFDMEDKKCEEEVDSWWFVAYEAIVAAPLSISESGDKLQDYAQGLFETLQDFVIGSAIGHFPLRLRMLRCFKDYVALIQQRTPGFAIVHSTLLNFMAFYSQYKDSVEKTLQAGRLALEKEMRDILLLASWKDVNINALRESAKRSHRKLFKVVRKYRTLLARPAQSIIEQSFPEVSRTLQISPAQVQNSTRVHLPDTRALQTCQNSLESWSERPARFKNVSTTVSNMLSMSQMHPSVMDLPAYLDQLTKNLSEDAESLRKETPSTATDDNAESMKHLTSRKRKLFSDVLKSVRHMGFRSNPSTDVLSQQASLAVVMTRVPSLNAAYTSEDCKASEFYLHHFLKLMPTVREASNSHSEELNGSEVVRSIGYFESMLSAAIKQRILLGDLAASLVSIDHGLEKMQNVWSPDAYTITLQSSARLEPPNVKRFVACLPHIISTGCIIIEKHGKLGQMDHNGLLAGLREWSRRFKTIATADEEELVLPEKFTSSQTLSNHAQARQLLAEFRAELHQKTQDHLDLAFVLKQIELWTDIPQELTNGHSDYVASLKVEVFDQSLLRLCDSILVAIQAFEKTTTETFTPEDRNWLVSSEKTLANGIKALHVVDISMSMDKILSEMCQLRQEELFLAAALTALALPIIRQYRNICHNVLSYTVNKSLGMNKLATTLAQSFSQIVSQGFCNPTKADPTEAGKDEKLEEGTGLGEGEGTEDISKDIKDDDDLTELAQDGQKSKEGEEIADQEDAVNMDQEELEGEMGDAEEKDDDGDEASQAGSDSNEIDEEIGDVDDLDPNAVDEKLWNEDSKEAEKDKEGEKGKGRSKKDDKAHMEGEQNDEDGDNAEEEEELSETGAEEGEKVAQPEGEMMDPHTQQEENLDLPDEMDLDGPDKTSVGSDVEDSDLDALSNTDTEGDEKPDPTGSDIETENEAGPKQDETTQDQQTDAENDESEGEKAEEAGSPVDTEPEDDDESNEGLLQNRNDDAAVDKDNVAPSDVQGLNGQDADTETEIQLQENKASGGTSSANDQVQADKQPQAAAKEGELGNLQDTSQEASDSRDPNFEDYTSQAFKKLGDALETWHRQQRKIQDAQSSSGPEKDIAEVDMTNTEFQHLEDEDAKGDTQALGAAAEDQASALDQRALYTEMQDQPQDFLPDEADQNPDEDTVMEEPDPQPLLTDDRQELPKPSTFIGPNSSQRQTHDPNSFPLNNDPSLSDLDTNLSLTHLTSSPTTMRSLSSAQALWTHHSSATLSLSQHLTSQLRLILTPTLATKMRGDFRTGKRLNIKRIIPYIASDYKRDKIWMRRSIPSKRNYQIMLAVDDSKSMAGLQGGGEGLAFETLALISKSLSMLEVGELCILGFGENVKVAHPFDKPFTDEAGVNVFQQFSFQQQRTNILRLVEESIHLFREARRGNMAANSAEIWQLELIISDGVCEEHEAIRRLVRQATEERIMIVFIIIDSINAYPSESAESSKGKEKGTSIVDMQTAVFEADGEEGEKQLKIKRYLDGFPFGYYVVVGDVRELPGVLSQALRGWFGEVVERG
ncbi:MAG: hypothetical protein Q9209_000994 [Squamulea sp. 1 TL-2023]